MTPLFLRSFPAIVSLIILASACTGSVKTVRSPAYSDGSIKRIAVAGLAGPNKETGDAIADSIIPDLIEMGFTVVERNRLEALLQEQQLQQTGLTDSATALKIGQMLNVDTILVGNYSAHQETAALPNELLFNMGRGHRGGGVRIVHRRPRGGRLVFTGRFSGVMSVAATHHIYRIESLSLRLVSVQTGEILISSARKTPFASEDLGDVLEDMADSLRKSLGKT